MVWGPTKASGVQQFAADHQVDLGSSYFYADGDEDLVAALVKDNWTGAATKEMQSSRVFGQLGKLLTC